MLIIKQEQKMRTIKIENYGATTTTARRQKK